MISNIHGACLTLAFAFSPLLFTTAGTAPAAGVVAVAVADAVVDVDDLTSLSFSLSFPLSLASLSFPSLSFSFPSFPLSFSLSFPLSLSLPSFIVFNSSSFFFFFSSFDKTFFSLSFSVFDGFGEMLVVDLTVSEEVGLGVDIGEEKPGGAAV